jgi:hypothetical protein
MTQFYPERGDILTTSVARPNLKDIFAESENPFIPGGSEHLGDEWLLHALPLLSAIWFSMLEDMDTSAGNAQNPP